MGTRPQLLTQLYIPYGDHTSPYKVECIDSLKGALLYIV